MKPKKLKSAGATPVAAGSEQEIQKVISVLPTGMQDKVVNTIDPVAEEIMGDAKKGLQEMTNRLGRKPTFEEFAGEMFPGLFGKVINNKKVVNAAKGVRPDEKNKLSDGNKDS